MCGASGVRSAMGQGAEQFGRFIEDGVWFAHSTGADGAAGLPADVWSDQMVAEQIAECADVVLDGGVGPHVGVHGGGDKHGGVFRHGTGDKADHVIGKAEGDFGNDVGGGGGDDEKVGPSGDADVLRIGMVIGLPDAGEHGLAGEGSEGGWADELGRSIGHQHADIRALLSEAADKGSDFVTGDAAGEAHDNTPANEVARSRALSRVRRG